MQNRGDQGCDARLNLWQGIRREGDFGAPEERYPLCLLFSGEGRCQRNWQLCWHGRLSPCERRLNGPFQHRPFECEGAGNRPYVEEVLHSGIQHAQRHHGVELLRDHGFRWVGFKGWDRLIEQRWIFDFDGARRDDVAVADVHMYRQTGAGEPGVEAQADAAVLILFTRGRSAQRRRAEDDTIVLNVDGEDFGEYLDEPRGGVVASAKQIEIASRPVGLGDHRLNGMAPLSTKCSRWGERPSRYSSRSMTYRVIWSWELSRRSRARWVRRSRTEMAMFFGALVTPALPHRGASRFGHGR